MEGDEEGIKYMLVKICSRPRYDWKIDEPLCRAFVSMADGTIDGIEDLC